MFFYCYLNYIEEKRLNGIDHVTTTLLPESYIDSRLYGVDRVTLHCYLNHIEESRLYGVDPDFQTADNLNPEKNRLKLSLKGIVSLIFSDPLCMQKSQCWI